ncbi:MAG: hypothetical protein JW829_13915 [Pirellulales bacterium]|nr:hypothetical protein [Pirellulales bacterium]
MPDALSIHCRISWFSAGLLFFLGFPLSPRIAFPDEPEVYFDLPGVLACYPVELETAPDRNESNEWERIVEVQLPVSLCVRSGDAAAIEQISLEILTNDDDMRVVDFAPKTKLETDISCEIEKTTTTEVSSALGASLGGGVPMPYGELIAQVTPSANASRSQRNVTTESTKRLPPQEATIVSGTMHRGRGLFFQFRRSSQNTLEGTQTLTIRFAVPTDWRIARAKVVCRATGQERFLWMKKEAVWSTMQLPVILYAEGDMEAKELAERAAAKIALLR